MLDQWTAFQNLPPTLPTIQLSHGVTSLEALDYFFTLAKVLAKTCKHTLMCTVVGVTLQFNWTLFSQQIILDYFNDLALHSSNTVRLMIGQTQF